VKALSPITATDEGIQIEESEEQHPKTELSIRDNLEFAWKVTVESRPQYSKQFSPMSSMAEGMQIEESAKQSQKADLSIRDSLESAWKVTAERF
jgi:predicted HicB family RNase H-like nuclease